MTLFLTASSFYSIFTQVPKTFNSTVALRVGFLKHLGDVTTVLVDLICLSLFCFFMSFQTDWMMDLTWFTFHYGLCSVKLSMWRIKEPWTVMVRSDLYEEHWLLSDSLWKQKSHWIITINGKMNVWKCKLIFPTDTLQPKIEITDLNPFLAGENMLVF